MRHWARLHASGYAETICHPNGRQYVSRGSRYCPGSDLHLCIMPSTGSDMEFLIVSSYPLDPWLMSTRTKCRRAEHGIMNVQD